MDAKVYEEDFRAIYEKFLDIPEFLTQMRFVIPFHIPVRPGTCITYAHVEGEISTLLFHTIQTSNVLDPGIVSNESVDMPIKRSIVHFFRTTNTKQTAEKSFFSECTNDFVSLINNTIRSYLVLEKDFYVYRISREMLNPITLARIAKLPAFSDTVDTIFIVNTNIQYKRDDIEQDRLERIIHYSQVILKNWNPFIDGEELMLVARRQLVSGFYRDSILSTQSSIESFLNTLYYQSRVMEGVDRLTIETELQETAFITMVKREFSARIGGVWDITLERSRIYQWYTETYTLRNRVAHAGYTPSHDEAHGSHSAAVAFREYVVDLINKANDPYRKLVKYLDPKTETE